MADTRKPGSPRFPLGPRRTKLVRLRYECPPGIFAPRSPCGAPERYRSKEAHGSQRRSSAARSRSSGSRSRGGRARSGPTSTSTLRAGKDGKYKISCPKCRAEYNVPENYLDNVVQCKHCKSSFTPRNAAKGSTRRQAARGGAGTGLLKVAFIVAPFLLFGLIYKLANSGDDKKEPPKVAVQKRWLTPQDEPYLAFAEFVRGVSKNMPFVVEKKLDWPSIYAATNPEKAKANWSLQDNKAKSAFMDGHIKGIVEGELGQALKDFDLDGELFQTAVLWPKEAKALTFSIEYPHKERRNFGYLKVEGNVEIVGSVWKTKSWKILKRPDPDAGRSTAKRKRRKKHKTIKAPKRVETTLKGKKIALMQSDIVPVAHLDSTPPDVRKKIDKLIDTVFAPNDADPRAASQAAFTLQDIGKPAVPRILHSMYERPCKTENDRVAFNMLVKTYNNIVGSSLAFLPGTDLDSTFGGSDEDRLKLMKSVFANWWRHYHKDGKLFEGTSDEELDKAMNEGSGSKRKTSK